MNRIVTLPPGRLVWGHPAHEIKEHTFEGPNKGKKLIDDDGNPYSEYAFGVAIPKSDPAWPEALAKMKTIAAADYLSGRSTKLPFSGKITDGDDPKQSKKEGYAGHWIVNCKSRNQAAKVFQWLEGRWREVLNPLQDLKCGYFIQVAVRIAGNKIEGDKAGVYVNGYQVALLGYGEEIIRGQSVEETFGAAAPPLPPGASAVPLVGPIPAQEAVPVPPVLPVPPVVPAALPPTSGEITLTPKSKGHSWEQLQTFGYTEETARRDGLIV